MCIRDSKIIAHCLSFCDRFPVPFSSGQNSLSPVSYTHLDVYKRQDEENVFLSLFAKTVSNAKLVAKVNRLAFDDVIDNLDIGSVIYPKYITADYIPVSYTHLDVYKRQT